MPRRLRIGHVRAVRMSGDAGAYTLAGQAANVVAQRRVQAVQGAYSVAGQSATLTAATGGGAAVTVPAWVVPLAVNQWHEIPDTNILALGGNAATVDAWNGYALKRSGSRLLGVANGGHTDYGGNEVTQLNLSSATPRWRILRAASSVPTAPYGPDANPFPYYSDGTPASRHTYYSSHHIESAGRVFLLGRGSSFPWNDNGRETDGFDLSLNAWDAGGTWPLTPLLSGQAGIFPGRVQAQHPTTGDVYMVHPSGGLIKFSASTLTYSLIPSNGMAGIAEGGACIDPVRNRLVTLCNGGGSGNGGQVTDLTTAVVTNIGSLLNGPGWTFLNIGVNYQNSHGLIYDEVNDVYLAKPYSWYSGTTNATQIHPVQTIRDAVVRINPTTWYCDLLTTTGTVRTLPGDTDYSGTPNGDSGGPVYTRFRYVPELQGLVYYPIVKASAPTNSNVYFMRLNAPAPETGYSITTVPLTTQFLGPKDWCADSGTYERYRLFAPITADTHQYEFRYWSGLTVSVFPGGQTYTLLVDGVVHGTVTPAAGASSAAITFRALEAGHGWHKLDLTGAPSAIPTWVYVKRPGGAAQTLTYVQGGSHDTEQDFANTQYQWAVAPARYTPTPRPITPRVSYPNVVMVPGQSSTTRRQGLYMQHLLPHQYDDHYRPRDVDGVIANPFQQYYLINPVMDQLARAPQLDGPRGVNSVGQCTHLQLATNSDAIFFAQGARIGRIEPNGNVVTLLGQRSPSPAPWHNTPVAADFDLVGDWSAVPANKRFLWEVWGFAWNEISVRRDTAQTIPNDLKGWILENPHFAGAGPKLHIADTQNNRVVNAVFSSTQHNVPPVVTEFITGMADPWGLVQPHDGLDILYVSERKLNRISKWNASTGAYLGNLVQGPAFPYFSGFSGDGSGVGGPGNRQPILIPGDPSGDDVTGPSLRATRSASCVMPEGLAWIPELPDWIYFGSLVQQQVRRVHKTTGEIQVVCDVPQSVVNRLGAFYFHISVSDGTFFGLGDVFIQMWNSNNSGGLPNAYEANGRPPGTLTLSATSVGTGRTATASVDSFSASNIGRQIICDDAGIAGIATITAVASSTVATVQITTAFATSVQASGTWRVDKPIGYGAGGLEGPGMPWAGFIYGAASAVGRGRMIFSSATEGVFVISKSAGETTYPYSAAYGPASVAWRHHGLHLLHGTTGHGPYGLPLPWGVSTETDNWLTMHGHTDGKP